VSAWVWTAVAAVGGVGALCRFLLDGAIASRAGRAVPVGTLAVNASGALLLGFLAGIGARGAASVILGAALLGSYTTFSTWMFETHRLAEDGELRWAAANVLLSLAVGVAAAAVGRAIGAHA
jgi:CrcB protein